MTPQETNKLIADFKAGAETHFESWLQNPLVKVLISQMPPGESQELLPQLLRGAFDAGNAYGQVAISMAFIEKMMKDSR